jgi:hypothetical protein
MFKILHGFYDLDVFDFVSFVNHCRTYTSNCNNPSLVLKVPSCKLSSIFQSSFFNRIVPLWNHTCKIVSPGDLRSLATFKSFLSRTYFNLLSSNFDVDILMLTSGRTWSLYRSCSCHRNSYIHNQAPPYLSHKFIKRNQIHDRATRSQKWWTRH